MYLDGDFINLHDDPKQNLLKVGDKYYQITWLKNKGRYFAGGNGTVFTLLDEQEGFEYAIKFLKFPDHLYNHPRLGKRVKRFDREIQALYIAKDNSLPNIVEIEFDGRKRIGGSEFSYYVMQKCQFTLREYLSKTNLSFPQKTLLCQKILLGIIGLHEYQIYHRDIKHDNIFIIDNEPYIGDLGLVENQNSDILIDEEGDLIGPTGWFSPEALNKSLCEGKYNSNPNGFDCVIDAKSEVFQLGKLFWYIYQGNIPVGQVLLEDFVPNNSIIYDILFSMLKYSKPLRSSTESVLADLNKYLSTH